MIEVSISESLPGDEEDVMWALFRHGPLFDGDVPSKQGRSNLVDKGLVGRAQGFNYLTGEGLKKALDYGMDARRDRASRKEREMREGETQERIDQIARICCFWAEGHTCHDNYCVTHCRAKTVEERYTKMGAEILRQLYEHG